MNHMLTIAAGIFAVSAFIGLAATNANAAGEVVVVELFQSQGCSSCPPANANVNALTARGDILALSFGVTYWDRLGWKDTFATPEYTNRQYDYMRGLHLGNVYTPQVVVNGRQDLSGINHGELESAIARAAHLPTLSFDAGGVSLRAGAPRRAAADVWLVRYDPRTIEVPIQAGENGGRTLPHTNIVRELTRIGTWNGNAQTYRVAPSPGAGLKTAILLQEPNGGPILAALKL